MEKGFKRARTKKSNKKGIIIAVAGIVAIILICTIFSAFERGTVTVTVPDGTSTREIAKILKANDVIDSELLFLARVSVSKYRGKLQYGTFEFDKKDSMGEIIKALATEGAKKSTITITVPEGFSAERIKALVVDSGLSTESDFEAALQKEYDYPFLASVPEDSAIKYKLQGFLYPSTYEFYHDATAESIVTTMLEEYQKQTANLNIENHFDMLVRASLIEREAKLDSERAMISGVINNRIEDGMRLQIDATVVYAISDGMYDVDRVYYKDLETASPYNTYKYAGLPVGPICSPGIESINAAINPSVHNYLFYHTDTEKNDGSHIFTETFQEHKETMN